MLLFPLSISYVLKKDNQQRQQNLSAAGKKNKRVLQCRRRLNNALLKKLARLNSH